MSSSDDDDSHSSREGEDNSQDNAPLQDYPEPDANTLRVLISTDNHLGYLETDPIRGMDSFAAFEEVLHLAKQRKVDMILLGGDLFHHNKPSRRTLHKTMEILRRYTMGPDPVKIQILSDQKRDFRGAGSVNYEDANYSVDLPIFSIHGNHDDPTREGNDMLAALDLLNIANFVNYFGRQDAVDKVEISPVLIQKGDTQVALYGLGNMRDERLNRMWQQKKVQFLRPSEADDAEWFNVFVLHQNRDNMGRGAKNCIHESMIPSWMDLAVFGHEHASEPQPAESVVGTFRITQPGSSVATSLTDGESHRKHCVVMDVRGCQFRLNPIPLTMIRSFVMHEVSLKDNEQLDPESQDIDKAITKILVDVLHTQIFNAREKQKRLQQDAMAEGNQAANEIKFQMTSPALPLVRLRVEHSGFSTLNNQRFGAKFVGKVANPSDILLFHRSKKQRVTSSSGKGKGTKSSKDPLEDPMVPGEIEKVSVEDLVRENLEQADQKLGVLKQKDLALALEGFVDKMEVNAIPDVTDTVLKQRQQRLMREKDPKEQEEEEEAADESMEEDDSMEQDTSMDRSKSFESRASSTASKRKRSGSFSDDSFLDKENQASKGKSKAKKTTARKKNAAPVELSSDGEDDEEPSPSPKKKPSASSKSTKSTARGSSKKAPPSRSGSGDIRQWTQSRSSQASQATAASKRTSKKKKPEPESDGFEDDSDVEVVSTKRPQSRRRNNAPVNYSVDRDSDDDVEILDDSEEEKPKKKRGRTTAKSRGRKASQNDESFDLSSNWGSASTRR